MTSETHLEDIRSPWSGEVVGRARLAGHGELDAAAGRAVRGFFAWRAAPAWRRAEALLGIAHGIAAEGEALARTIALEAAKPIVDARAEVVRAVQTFTLASEESKRLVGEYLPLDLLPGSEGRSALVRRVPAGPVLAITPFNFPLNLVAHKVAPALAAGCSIVLKPAPQTPAHRAEAGGDRARGRRARRTCSRSCRAPTSSRRRSSATPRSPCSRSPGATSVGWRAQGRSPGRSASCSSSVAMRR